MYRIPRNLIKEVIAKQYSRGEKGLKSLLLERRRDGARAYNRDRTGTCKCKGLTRYYAFKMSGLFLNEEPDRRRVFWRNPRYANLPGLYLHTLKGARDAWTVRSHVATARSRNRSVRSAIIRANCIISPPCAKYAWRDYGRHALRFQEISIDLDSRPFAVRILW